MVNTSTSPLSVDGVRLDTMAWNVSKINRATAARRPADISVPGLDGVFPSLDDPIEPATLSLDMTVFGRDADGAIPVAGSQVTLRKNLDILTALLTRRTGLLTISQTMPDATVRVCYAKVVDPIVPEFDASDSTAMFSVTFFVPSGVWEDAVTSDWTSGEWTPTVYQEVTTLRGATEQTADAKLLVSGYTTGAGLSPVIRCGSRFMVLNVPLVTGEKWLVDLGTWESRRGSTLTLDSGSIAGTDAAPDTTHNVSAGGFPGSAFITLAPTPTGTGTTTAVLMTNTLTGTRLSIRAKRKFAI